MYSVLCSVALCPFHILSTPYLYYCTCTYRCLAWPRDLFHARRISLVIVARPRPLLMYVALQQSIERSRRIYRVTRLISLCAARQTRFYVISNISSHTLHYLAVAPCVANSIAHAVRPCSSHFTVSFFH